MHTTGKKWVQYYLQKISDDFNFGQKKSVRKKKPSEIFKRLKYLQFSMKLLCSSKPLGFLYGVTSSGDTAWNM